MTTPVSSSSQTDPLLACLEFLSGHFGQSKSASALVSGLSYDDKNMGADLFCEAANRIGLKTKVTKRPVISDISAAILPVVMILKDRHACVLLRISSDRQTGFIWSSDTASERAVTMTDLMSSYAGYVIFVHPRPEFINPEAPQAQDADRHWFWGAVWETRGLYYRTAIAAALINIFALVSPLFIMNVYDRVIPNNAIETGWVLGIGALTVFVFDFLMRTLRGYFVDLSSRYIDVQGGKRIYDQLLNIKLAGRPPSAGSFANMLKDFDSIREFLTSATLTTVIDLPFTLLFLGIIWIVGGPIALILAGLILLVVLTGALLQVPLKNYVRKSSASAEAKHGLLVETIGGLETIKAIGADGRLRARYGQYLSENAHYAQKSRFISGLGVNIATFLQQISSVLAVLAGMYLVQDQSLSVGALIAIVMLAGRAIAPIGQLANLMSRYHGAKGALKTLDSVMAKPVERPALSRFLHRPDIQGKIIFKNVSFSYPSVARKILHDISFTIHAGERVGIIGRIGSGKSTISRLMMGLYDPCEGTILFDDTDNRQIDPADLRRRMAYIAQDIVLFAGTIRDNITASVPHAAEEDILRVAKNAGVHDFVSQHPMGYDAPVGERGEGLSGGQRQAVALARAMLLNPSIYICDEPTNAMDTQAENALAQHIAGQTKNKTLILITHRQHLLSLVDRLILIDQGKIVMDAPRDQVLSALSSGTVEVRNS